MGGGMWGWGFNLKNFQSLHGQAQRLWKFGLHCKKKRHSGFV